MKNIDYGKIIKRSWEVTKKNKWLWVVGIVSAAFGGGSYSGSSGSSGSHSGTTSPGASPAPTNFENIKNQTSNVLGATTNAIDNWFKTVPTYYWVLFVLAVFITVLFFIILRWVIKSWATGALIFGFEDADLGKQVDLKSMTPQGLSKIKSLMIFGLISFGAVASLILSYLLILGIGFLVKLVAPTLGAIWLILFGFVGTIGLIILMVIFSMLTVYSERLIVLKNFSPWEAWKKGFGLTKHNFIATAIMGFINSAIGCVTGCGSLFVLALIFAIPGYLLVYPIFANGFVWPGIGQIIGVFVLVTLFISANLLIKGIVTVFNCGNWNLFFRELMNDEKSNDK